MDDWQRKADELVNENRKRRARVSPWAIAGMIIAIPIIALVRCWPALPSG